MSRSDHTALGLGNVPELVYAAAYLAYRLVGNGGDITGGFLVRVLNGIVYRSSGTGILCFSDTEHPYDNDIKASGPLSLTQNGTNK